jgi:hypothetical protein
MELHTMTDLREHIQEFDAAARRILQAPPLPLVHARPAPWHPTRPHRAQGLCDSCYTTAWHRGQLPTHRPIRHAADFAADYELLRDEGYTRRQIAERMRMTYSAVTQAYRRAVKADLLTPDRRRAA